VRAITHSTGVLSSITYYKPYGPAIDTNSGPTIPLESKGFTGERFDASSDLLYLNARFYDPSLGRFIQPDWWEVTEPG
jgi:RHS repeat-associated protein